MCFLIHVLQSTIMMNKIMISVQVLRVKSWLSMSLQMQLAAMQIATQMRASLNAGHANQDFKKASCRSPTTMMAQCTI